MRTGGCQTLVVALQHTGTTCPECGQHTTVQLPVQRHPTPS